MYLLRKMVLAGCLWRSHRSHQHFDRVFETAFRHRRFCGTCRVRGRLSVRISLEAEKEEETRRGSAAGRGDGNGERIMKK